MLLAITIIYFFVHTCHIMTRTSNVHQLCCMQWKCSRNNSPFSCYSVTVQGITIFHNLELKWLHSMLLVVVMSWMTGDFTCRATIKQTENNWWSKLNARCSWFLVQTCAGAKSWPFSELLLVRTLLLDITGKRDMFCFTQRDKKCSKGQIKALLCKLAL